MFCILTDIGTEDSPELYPPCSPSFVYSQLTSVRLEDNILKSVSIHGAHLLD